LGKEAASASKAAIDKFKEIFGREPRKTDPVFVGKYYLSDADLKRETLRAMRAAKVSPSLIYAYQKTSRIVINAKLLTPDELREYNEAIDEFYDLVESGVAEASELIDPDTPKKTMHKQLQSMQIMLVSCCRFRGHRDRCFMEPEVGHGATEIHAGVQA